MSERQEANEKMSAHVHDVSQEFGISRDITRRASRWAVKWQDVLTKYERLDEDDPVQLRLARDIALQDSPSVPLDQNGRASFRAEFAAEQILYKIMPEQAPLYRHALEGDGLRVIPHFDQLDAVVDTLLEARANHEFPYTLEAANLPQDERNMPPELPRGGRGHANFLWAACYYMRGGIKSTAAFAGLSSVYAAEPELFDPHHAMNDDPERITELLKAHSLAFSSSTIGPAWVENARRMVELYDGDPRQIFAGTTNYDVLLSRVKNNGRGKGFVGFQEKMVSMITYYLMDSELIPYFDFPLPVDFHVLRVSAANEIITFENLPEDGDIYSDKTLATLRAMYHDFSVTHGVSQLDVCNAVWSLSSAICGTQPGNIMHEKDRNNRDGRNTYIKPMPIDTSDSKQIKMYERSCGLCPLEQSCAHNMPSKEYYIRGRAILSERKRFPTVNETLFADNALRRMTRKKRGEQHYPELAANPNKGSAVETNDETLF